jgi:hypothetical protein
MLDSLQIIFWATKLFVETKIGAPVLGGPDPKLGSVLTGKIPLQIPIKDPEVKKKKGRSVGVAGDLG